MTIEHDPVADALYIALSAAALEPGCVARTVRVTEDVALDFDAEGRLLGVEVLNARRGSFAPPLHDE
ncbi:MAG: DUF2283 domain-containing protein [Chloroflexi bacterium]|nr:DUF2283 domain-containing protein [Chloroflexota bacterium]